MIAALFCWSYDLPHLYQSCLAHNHYSVWAVRQHLDPEVHVSIGQPDFDFEIVSGIVVDPEPRGSE